MTTSVDNSRDQEKRQTNTLHIGSGGEVTWAGTASLDWLAAYGVIFCQPDADSEAEQLAFIPRLQETFGTDRRWNGRVVWVANKHFSAAIAGAIGCGTLSSLPRLPEGEVLSMFHTSPLSQPAFAFRDLSRNWLPFAVYRSRDHNSELIVGASSADGRWVVVPEGFSAQDFVKRGEFLQRRLPMIWAAILLFVIVGILATEYRSTNLRLRRDVARIGHSEAERFAAPHDPAATAGPTPAERMVSRVLWQQPNIMNGVAPEIRFGAAPFDLWKASKNDRKGTAYFHLALMSGDLASAYRIAAAAMEQKVEGDDWPHQLTETLWQRAAESIDELDFTGAETYTAMYIALSDLYARNAPVHTALEPQRNRTMARILLQELRARRIRSLCRTPDAAAVFGRLLGGEWGERLNHHGEGVDVRRRENVARFCRQPVIEFVDYSGLAALEQIVASTDLSTIPICKVVGRECEFLKQRSALLDYSNAILAGSVPPASPIPGALAFSTSQSYLSDDLLATLFTISSPPADKVGLKIPADALDKALAVVDATSDHAGILRKRGLDVPCGSIVFTDNSPWSSALGKSIFGRCRT